MKNIFATTLLAFIVCFTACTKDNTAEADTTIFGTWELRQTSAAMLPTPSIYPQGNGTILKLTKDGKYEMFNKGQFVKSGTYIIGEDSSFEESVCMARPEGQFKSRIIYDGDMALITISNH